MTPYIGDQSVTTTYTLAQLEPILKLKNEQIRQHIKCGNLDAINVGTGSKRARYVVEESALRRFIESRRVKPAASTHHRVYQPRW